MTSAFGTHVMTVHLGIVCSMFDVFFQPEGEDELKKMQLMELAILNGTYRDNKFIVPMTMAAARKCPKT